MPIYRAKWSPGVEDNDAFPAFEASNLHQAVLYANATWPAKPGEDDFDSPVMQIKTDTGWQWAVKWPRCYGMQDDGPGCAVNNPCWEDFNKCIRRSHEKV